MAAELCVRGARVGKLPQRRDQTPRRVPRPGQVSRGDVML